MPCQSHRPPISPPDCTQDDDGGGVRRRCPGRLAVISLRTRRRGRCPAGSDGRASRPHHARNQLLRFRAWNAFHARKRNNWLRWLRLLASGGSGEIRTHGRVAPSLVFKTSALNRSATLPRVPSIAGSGGHRLSVSTGNIMLQKIILIKKQQDITDT